ncbi:MAG: hypothetical protein H5U01_15910 [Clostridia bacterium]|nr:hypothetical protein [Clostridia bacterium]
MSKSKKKKKKNNKSADDAVQSGETSAVVSNEGQNGQPEGAFSDSVVMSGDPTVVVSDVEILNFEEIAEPETSEAKRDSE